MKETYAALLTLKGKLPFVSIDAGGNLREVKERVLNDGDVIEMIYVRGGG